MFVTEVKAWGVQCMLFIPGASGNMNAAYYRAEFGTFAKIGRPAWTPSPEHENTNDIEEQAETNAMVRSKSEH